MTVEQERDAQFDASNTSCCVAVSSDSGLYPFFAWASVQQSRPASAPSISLGLQTHNDPGPKALRRWQLPVLTVRCTALRRRTRGFGPRWRS